MPNLKDVLLRNNVIKSKIEPKSIMFPGRLNYICCNSRKGHHYQHGNEQADHQEDKPKPFEGFNE